MLPVLIGLGIAYLASEAVSKNNDKKKRQAMQANHVSKVKQLENRINKLKTELKKYGAEIETAKAITEKNLKKLDDMLLALKRVEKNLGDTSFTGASSASASLLVFGNSLQRAIERKKLQEKYDLTFIFSVALCIGFPIAFPYVLSSCVLFSDAVSTA